MAKTYIIAGGRDFGNRTLPNGETDVDWHAQCYNYLATVCSRVIQMDKLCFHIIHGGAAGADYLGAEWASIARLPCTIYPARWKEHGRAVGSIRNKLMADNADALVAFWDGNSKGTKHMIDTALKLGLEVHVYRYEGETNGV